MGNDEQSKHEHHHTSEALTLLRLSLKNLEMADEMLVNGKPCVEVVRRLSGVVSLLIECKSLVANDHLLSCVQSALKPGQESVINELKILVSELSTSASKGSHH